MAAPATVTRPQASRLGARPPPPPLESGDRLGAAEFLRRYEEMPRIKKAELIEGIVCREYVPNMPDDRGVLRGPHFPGLALAVDALLAHDSANWCQKPAPSRARTAAAPSGRENTSWRW